MNLLLDVSYIKDTYYISGNVIKGYGVLILSKFPCHFFEMPFPTLMGRSLLIAEPIGGINNQQLLVGTVHLESSDNAEQRKK